MLSFDRVNHDMLMARVAKRVGDKRLLRIIRAFLNAGVMENGLAWLFRLLQNTVGVYHTRLVDSAATSLLHLEAVETGPDPIRRTA